MDHLLVLICSWQVFVNDYIPFSSWLFVVVVNDYIPFHTLRRETSTLQIRKCCLVTCLNGTASYIKSQSTLERTILLGKLRNGTREGKCKRSWLTVVPLPKAPLVISVEKLAEHGLDSPATLKLTSSPHFPSLTDIIFVLRDSWWWLFHLLLLFIFFA